MSPFRIIFCGTPDTAVPSLTALAADPAFEILLVITQPDRPKGRGLKLQPSPVAVAAKELGLEVAKPEDINRFAFRTCLPAGRFSHFAFLVVVAYGQLLKKEILQLPAIAPVNLHFSLLPRWRGASPVEHAILNGDRETGVSIIRLTEELDAGPILAQECVKFGGRETTLELKEKLAVTGAKLLVDTLKKPLKPREQEGEIIQCRKIEKRDGHTDLAKLTASEVDRRVRAFTPWPGVWVNIRNQSLKIVESSLEESGHSLPLTCKDGTTLYAKRVQVPGKRVMEGEEWERGRREVIY